MIKQRVIWLTVTTEPPTLPTNIVLDSFPVCGSNTKVVDPRTVQVEFIAANVALYIDNSIEPVPPPDREL